MSLSSRYNMVAADLMSSKCSEKSRLGGLLWMGRVEHNPVTRWVARDCCG
jgi:hypothetical protein